jgi:transcriptional pleiotropic regulator of transition state genes
MKSTGIVRKVDELGRVVIPIELRNQFKIQEHTTETSDN